MWTRNNDVSNRNMLKHFIYSSSSKSTTSLLCSFYYRYSSKVSSFFCILSFLVIAISIDQTFYSATHYLAAVWLDSRHDFNNCFMKSFFIYIKRWSCFLSVSSDIICSSSRFFLACTFIFLLRCFFSHLLFNASVYCDEVKHFIMIALEFSLVTSITLLRLASIFLDHWRSKLSNTSIYEFLSSASDSSCRVILSWWSLKYMRSRIDWIFSSNLVKNWHENFCIASRSTRMRAQLILIWYYSVSLIKSMSLWVSMKAFFW